MDYLERNHPPVPTPILLNSSSEISPFFLNKVERLSDDSDDDNESKSSTTTSSSGHNSEESWDFKKKSKGSCESSPASEVRHSRKVKKSKKSKRKHSDSRHDGDEMAKVKRKKCEKKMEDDVSMALPKISKKKRAAESNGLDEVKIEATSNEDEKASTVISSYAQRMMANMGYRKGEGLGKHGQGRVAPVDVSKQKGRRGLGMVIKDVDLSSIRYDPTQEVIDVFERVSWLINETNYDFSQIDMHPWMVVGDKKRILDDETHFCDSKILKNVLICKTALDKLQGEEIRRARSRSNPFEAIKKGPFMNRAAMKMANMDTVFDFMFTNPIDEYQILLVNNYELLYFADVCAGPGGFSEYVLSKKRWGAKGFGFTLKGDNDFRMADFYAGPCESFEPFYGECEDGDVYKSRNITSFVRHVMENTEQKGVHFMMADGGFSVEGQENIQEILSKRLYLCQCLVALSIVRQNGHFVCKLFDLFTPFSVGLIFLMYHCFKKITIHKPNTSRPANSERYIVCKWRRQNVSHIREYMSMVNEAFNDHGEAFNSDINEIVPLDIIKSDENFYNYICASNNEFGLRQVNSLAKILEFAEDESLVEEKQQELKKACMDLWGIPIRARRGPSFEYPDNVCRTILQNDLSLLREQSKKILNFNLNESLYTIHDYYAVVLGTSNDATFFLGVSHKKCFRYDRSKMKWIQMLDVGLELSPDTLVFGEIVLEVIGQSLGQRKINSLHIIDGHTLGGTNISALPYTERMRQCALYAKSLRRPSMNSVMPIRPKKVFELDDLNQAFMRMKNITMKNSRTKLVYCINSFPDNNEYFIPLGLMFIKHTKAPYKRFVSKNNNYKYFWAPQKEALFDKDRPKESVSNLKESYENSLYWVADENENVPFNRQSYIDKLMAFITNNRFTKRDEK